MTPPALKLDLVLVRSRDEKKIAKHILTLLKEHQAVDVCKSLLTAVDKESLEPQVFSIFLSATKSIDCILLCLHQPHSLFVRQQAIKQYGKAFGDVDRWEGAWKALGSTAGILEYLSEVSVWEVRSFLRSIGSSIHGENKPKPRALAIEELLKAMNPSLYPDAPYKTKDKRPLEKYAIPLVPACSADFVLDLINRDPQNQLYSQCSKTRLINVHGDLLREHSVQALFSKDFKPFPNDIDFYINVFASKEPTLSSKEKKFSASMTFSERLLRKRLDNIDAPWPSSVSETKVYMSLLNRCIVKEVTKSRLHEIMELGMDLLATTPINKEYLRGELTRSLNFWQKITYFWRKWPEHWEDLVVKGLRMGLAGSVQDIPVSFFKFANREEVKKDRAWYLLRLFSLHAAKDGADIDKTDDLKFLAKQKWTMQTFNKLSDEKIIHLLKMLLRVNQSFDFLQPASNGSILSMQSLHPQRNFNVLLFLTQVQARSVDEAQREQARNRVEGMLEDLKKKSASSKDQPERANLAKAAGFVAIASGSLEVFGGHIAWLQRFIRDPLTTKIVFSTRAIGSRDASNLLSGIPDDPTDDLSLDEISASVGKANAILLMLHEHHKVAKREPSYQRYDWDGVAGLLQDAIKARIARAKILQQSLDASQGELYGAIWSQTFAMYSKVGSESMFKVQYEMQTLMTQLPPKVLATTTQAMLETDNQYRATKSSGKEAEDESRIIESLTYQCLLALAKGDKPSLAEDLIVRIIIDRPDASSWHRQMLSLSFFKRLPAKNAEQLLLGFAKAIGEKLEEQSYVRLGEPAGTPSFVKVTTVKYLAQLLQDAQFLSPDAAIDVLLELFKVATHPDIRFATLESMLSTLRTLSATDLRGSVTSLSQIKNPLIVKILKALDAVIPVVGSINERRPPREQDWLEAREDLSKLPEPLHGAGQPLWTALTSFAMNHTILKSYFVNKLLLPIIETSMSEHRKWLTLFLKKHAANITLQDLPALPLEPNMTGLLLWSFPTLVPREALEQIDSYTRFMLAPPAALKRFIARLKSNEETRHKPEVQHFLALFDVYPQIYTHQLITLIHHTWQASTLPPGRDITLQQVQSAILAHLEIVLQLYDENTAAWTALVEKLRHNHHASAAEHKKWITDCRTVLEQVVRMVNGKRTPKWGSDPERKPSVLPSTAKLKLWLLTYPMPGEVAGTSSEGAGLGGDLVSWLKEQFDTSRSLDFIVNAALTVTERLSVGQTLRAALVVGTGLKDNDSIGMQMLRVEVAKGLVGRVGRDGFKKEGEKDEALKSRMREMVLGWEKSKLEEVREVCLEWKVKDRSFWNEVVSVPKA